MKRNISVFANHLHDDFEESLKLAKEYGYEYVDICTYNGKILELVNETELQEIKALLKKYDLKVCTVLSTLFMNCKLHEDYEIKSINPAWTFFGDFEEQTKMFEHMCQVVKDLAAINIRVYPFRWPNNKGIVGDDEDLALMAKVFKKVATIAENKQVMVVVENCPYTHCPKGEMTYKLCQLVASPNFKMCYDPGNSYRAFREHVPTKYLGKNQTEELTEFISEIGQVHFKDYHYDEKATKPFMHVALGSGDLDFVRFKEILDELNYQGMIACEPEVAGEENIIKSMEFLQNINH